MSGTTNTRTGTDLPPANLPPTSGSGPRRSGALLWVAILMIVMGVFAIWMGFKYLNGGQSGGVSVVDASYRQPPANSKDPWLKQFTLTERSGKQFSSQQLKGQPYVTSFFFASCPAYCMQQNQKVAGVAAEYGPKGVKFVSISVDPENDTPSVLREYAHRLNADPEDWLFLTGDQKYIARVGAEMFSVIAEKLTHSEKLVVSDKWGNIRGRYYWNDPAEMAQLRTMLDQLLAETEEPEEFKNQSEPTIAPVQSEESADQPTAEPEAAPTDEAAEPAGETR